jgi:ORF6N domain
MPKRQKGLVSTAGHNGRIDRAIRVVRGERVLLDTDLAALYEVSTRALVQSTKRNASRFPSDFMFQLAPEEVAALRSQNVISKRQQGSGGRRYRPYAFTEHGVAMLSSVLRSPRAVRVNIEIMRAFVRLRRVSAAHADLAARVDDLEDRYDEQFKIVFDAIRKLMAPSVSVCRRIGFRVAKAAR